jgi:UDP-N-acetyl-D-glucosamine dehydrogenase
LRAKGAQVRYHDPFVNELRFGEAQTGAGGELLESVTLADEELHAADCVVIVTNHSQFDYQRLCRLSSLMVDTRNALNCELRKGSGARIIRL